jgi:hypothetical protein
MESKKGGVNWMFISLVIAILVLLVYFFIIGDVSGIFRKGLGVLDPGEVALRASRCEVTLNQVDFCRFTEAGKNTYINCDYADIDFQASFKNENGYSCDTGKVDAKCSELVEVKEGETEEKRLARADKFSVNGRKCG